MILQIIYIEKRWDYILIIIICNFSSTTFNDYVKHILFFILCEGSEIIIIFFQSLYNVLFYISLYKQLVSRFWRTWKRAGLDSKQNGSHPEKCFVKVHFAFNFLFVWNLHSFFLSFLYVKEDQKLTVVQFSWSSGFGLFGMQKLSRRLVFHQSIILLYVSRTENAENIL